MTLPAAPIIALALAPQCSLERSKATAGRFKATAAAAKATHRAGKATRLPARRLFTFWTV